MSYRGIFEDLTARNRDLCHLNSFQMFLIQGCWRSGELSRHNDIITSRKGCCHGHQFISVLWVDTPFFWSHKLDLLPLPRFAENMTS